METEHLKIIIEALGTLGDGAKSAFIWWLFAENIAIIVGWTSTAAIAAWASVRVVQTLCQPKPQNLSVPALSILLRLHLELTGKSEGRWVREEELARYEAEITLAIRKSKEEPQ